MFATMTSASFSNCARVITVSHGDEEDDALAVEDDGCEQSPLIVSTAASGLTLAADAGSFSGPSLSVMYGGRYCGGKPFWPGESCAQAAKFSRRQASAK
jgi:hypothetical protein